MTPAEQRIVAAGREDRTHARLRVERDGRMFIVPLIGKPQLIAARTFRSCKARGWIRAWTLGYWQTTDRGRRALAKAS